MNADTESVAVIAATAPAGFWSRLRFRREAERGIDDLTRDQVRDDRIRAEAAVRLAPGPWAIAELFRTSRQLRNR